MGIHKAWVPLILGLALATGARADSHVRMVRLSLVTGAVEVQLPGATAWQPAMFQAPLLEGEHIRTLASGRAEIQLENGSTLRLIPNSQLDFPKLALSDGGEFMTTARLVSGTAFVTLRKHDSPGFRLLLPSGDAVVADGDSSFRADSVSAASSRLAVMDGKAKLQFGDQEMTVNKDESATASAERKPTVAENTLPPDPWTTWSHTRDVFFANALHNGVQPGSLISYSQWFDSGSGAARPAYYSGTGLAYLGFSSCPWTVTSGDYAGWCWQSSDGWYRPAVAPAPSLVQSANGNAASDITQTNTMLADARTAGAGTYAGLGVDPCFSVPANPSYGFNDMYSLSGGYGFYGQFLPPCGMDGMPWIGGFSPLGLDAYVLPPQVASGGGGAGVPTSPVRPVKPPLPPGQRFHPVGRGIRQPGQLHPPPVLRSTHFRAPTGLQASHTSLARTGWSGARSAARFSGAARATFTPTVAGPGVSSSFGAARAMPSSGGGMSRGGMGSVGSGSAPVQAVHSAPATHTVH